MNTYCRRYLQHLTSLSASAAFCIAVDALPLASQSTRDTSTAARIARIESSLIARSNSGADTGLSRTLPERMAERKVPGVSIAVFDNGRVIWAKGYGLRDVASGSRVDTLTLFQAASISKPVSAVGMLRLVEQGKLALDSDVNTMLRSWRMPPSPFTVTEKVTVRRIVSHMAGLTVHGFRGYAPGQPVPSLPQILDGLAPANSPPVRVDTFPGARESYSGGGVTVMQLLMQDVTGRPFDSLLTELVLRPTGMDHSTFAQPLPSALVPRSATGYRPDGNAVEGRYHVYPEQAAAGLWTTPSDLARFMLAVGRSYRGEAGALLQTRTAREMLTRVKGGGGLGFGISGEAESLRYRHDGGNEGFRCFAVAFFASGRGVVVMTNSDAGSMIVAELVSAVAREYGWPTL